MPVSRYMTPAELAESSGISEYAIRCWIRKKLNPLPHIRIGRYIKISEDDFASYLDGQKVH